MFIFIYGDCTPDGPDKEGTPQAIRYVSNQATIVFDSLGRASSVTNPLGAFTYVYVNATARLDHVLYPNGQRTNYSYFPNSGDQRLQQIQNLKPGGANLSTFGYTYDAEGVIQTWSRQFDGGSVLSSVFKHDLADQLTEAEIATAGSPVNFYWRHDKAGNRTSEQVGNISTGYTNNNLNQATAISAGGPVRFEGSLNEPGTVTVGGVAAVVAGDNTFKADVPLNPGTQNVSVLATDASGNTATKVYQVTGGGGSPRALTYDLNGSMSANGAEQAYMWDAENRMTKITYTSGATTEFAYDGLDRRVRIVEKNSGGTITSEKHFVWDGLAIAEERDGANAVTKRFYVQGQRNGAANFYYSKDHLGSIREMTDSAGAIEARYDYDPYGRVTKVSGAGDADFRYTGHYYHAISGLHLAPYRAYNADFGRWFSRDSLENAEMSQGPNLYAYVDNNPIDYLDLLGLSKGGQRNLNVNTGQGVLTKKSTIQEVQAAIKAAQTAGKAPAHLKALQGLLKVIKRGGSMELLFIPDIVEMVMEEMMFGGQYKDIEVPYDEKGCPLPNGKKRKIRLLIGPEA